MPSKSSKRPRKSAPNIRSAPRSGERKSPEEARVNVGEITSGFERSTLDPKSTNLIHQDEKTSQVPKGRLSGDVQSLSQEELADSESVEELVEEGQDFEGELVQGIENAPPADQGEVRTHAPAEPNEEAPDYKNRNRL